MKDLTIHIVEDEAIIAMDLSDMLESMNHQVKDISASFEEFNKKLPTDSSDLFLLDIKLKGDKDGFDVARELDKRNIPHIFISSHTDIRTLKEAQTTNSHGFIIKPFDLRDVTVAIQLAQGKIDRMLARQTVLINNGSGKLQVQLDDIIYAEADGNYTHIYTVERKITLRRNLKSTHSVLLNNEQFQRVHKSFVVNNNQINKISKNFLILKNGKKIPLGKSAMKDFETGKA